MRSMRTLSAAILTFAVLLSPMAVADQAPGNPVYVVSRERVLNEVRAARELQVAERRLTTELQSQVDRTKEMLAEEEKELAALRGSMQQEEFEARVQAFDGRMRSARRITQERAAELQRAFQRARAEVVSALPRLINEIRAELGADMILNADLVLSADASVDMTDIVIERYDAVVPIPPIPEFETSGSIFEQE